MTETPATYDTIGERDYPDQAALDALLAADKALTTLAVENAYPAEFNEEELGDLKMALIIVNQRRNHHISRRSRWWARRMEAWKETA